MRLFMLCSGGACREVLSPTVVEGTVTVVGSGSLFVMDRDDREFPGYHRGTGHRKPFGSEWCLYTEAEVVALRLTGKAIKVLTKQDVETGE
jgi:hypothetical protein